MDVRLDPTPPWTLYAQRQRWMYLAVLFLVSTSNYFDRYLISVLLEPIKSEFQVSDQLLGLLSGVCFAAFYAFFGMPVARWADRGNRRTIITLALSIWSVMTGLCGYAQSFWQLALYRVGVGAGESGGIPPAQSLLADYFPPERRATAIAIFTAASTAGYLLGFGLGGYVGATYGWRVAFLLAGTPGLLLALIVRLVLDEPRLQRAFNDTGMSSERLGETLKAMWRKRSYVYAVMGCLLYFFVSHGAFLFIPSFLVRVLHVPLAEASTTYGAVAAAASIVGTVGGGWLADRLGRRDIRWHGWLAAFACGLTAPLYVVAFAVGDLWQFMVMAFLGLVLLTGGLPPVFAAIHSICGNHRRAMAVAILFFSATLFGGGLGPLATGALSDFLSAHYHADGLRYSLMTMSALFVTGAIFFHAFGRAIPRDLER